MKIYVIIEKETGRFVDAYREKESAETYIRVLLDYVSRGYEIQEHKLK